METLAKTKAGISPVPLETLVGRERIEMTKTWKLIEWGMTDCPYCGGLPEVFTDAPENLVGEDDTVRCHDCGCPGVAVVDTPDAWIDWHDESGCECEWCVTHQEPPNA